jgi:uncharacterized protein YfaS (alpha-2-macroglobulin family)
LARHRTGAPDPIAHRDACRARQARPSTASDFIPGTGSIAISAALARSTRRLLAALQRYPYGCSEQTVSVALPPLYVNRLA